MIEALKVVISLLPALIEAIKAVEAALPESGRGAAKLAVVREVILAVDASLETAWPLLEKLVNGLVRVFNLFGIFGHSE